MKGKGASGRRGLLGSVCFTLTFRTYCTNYSNLHSMFDVWGSNNPGFKD